MTKEMTEKLVYLKMPGIKAILDETIKTSIDNSLSYLDFFDHLIDHEYNLRKQNRVERLLKMSKLPLQKTFDSFDFKRIPLNTQQKIKSLEDGSFLDRKENVLIFGNPGTGKTHLVAALADAQIK